jgi:TolB-like protein
MTRPPPALPLIPAASPGLAAPEADTAKAPEKSIAVLPFADLSEKKDRPGTCSRSRTRSLRPSSRL